MKINIDLNIPNIERFTKETGFLFNQGEIGMGRNCVGIVEPKYQSYIAYEINSDDGYFHSKTHSAEVAPHAYHKGAYLSVLCVSVGVIDAIQELEAWIGRILEKGYKIEMYEDKSAVAFFSGHKSVRLPAVVDKEL